MIQGWAREAGEDCTVEFRIRDSKSPVVSTDESDPWWRAFSSACKQRYVPVGISHSRAHSVHVFQRGGWVVLNKVYRESCIGN